MLLRGVLILALAWSDLNGAWARVQSANNATGAAGTTRVVTVTSTAAGSILIAGAAWATATARTISTITDNKSNIWTVLIERSDLTGNHNGAGFGYCLNPASGVTTITITMSGNASIGLDGYASEYTPPASTTVTAEAVTNSNTGSSTSATPGSITTTGSQDLVVVMALTPSASAVGSSFNLVDTADGNAYCDRLGAAAGSYNPAITTTSGNWVATIGAFIAAAAGNKSRLTLIGVGFWIWPLVQLPWF